MNKEQRKALISQMTVREKAEATVFNDGKCCKIDRFDQNGFMINDNPRGNEDYHEESPEMRVEGTYYPVSFPQASALSATWDEDMAFQAGAALGNACKSESSSIDVLLRPGVNIKRSPLCGRNFEYYSEDPLIAGKLGAAFIRGVQSEGTAACLKHFALNNQEFERMTTNAVVSERAIREIYLKPFEIAIKEGDPWTLMTSYNKVNGHWVPANESLMKVLREEFGFKGVIISDAFAIHTEKVESHRNGLDFEICGPGLHSAELEDAVFSGILPESCLDGSVDRMLELMDKLENSTATAKEDINTKHELARKIAAEGIVLLENDGILPLETPNNKLAIIGALAKKPDTMGGGSGHMNGHTVELPYSEICKLARNSVEYVPGYNLASMPSEEAGIDKGLIEQAVKSAKTADIVLFFTGLPYGYESEGYDRDNLDLPYDQIAALEAVTAVNNNVIVVNVSGAAVDLRPCIGKVRAILHSYLGGEAMGGAIADVIFGIAEPAGRLTETFPIRLQDTPAFINYPRYPQVMRDVLYSEDIFVGYRWYDKREIPVLFPFGYGLSYTTFTYGELSVEQNENSILLSIVVKNTGDRSGSQVLQLYVKPNCGGTIRPVKELRAFSKVRLNPGEEKVATFKLEHDAFSYYDVETKKWIVENGEYELLCGISSANIIADTKIDMVKNDRAVTFNRMTALQWFRNDPRTEELTKDLSEMAQKLFNVKGPEGALFDATPVYRFTENMFRNAALSPDELSKLIFELNQKDKTD